MDAEFILVSNDTKISKKYCVLAIQTRSSAGFVLRILTKSTSQEIILNYILGQSITKISEIE